MKQIYLIKALVNGENEFNYFFSEEKVKSCAGALVKSVSKEGGKITLCN